MRQLGRALQHLGLLAPPVAIILQLGQIITVKHLLLFLVAAVSAFWLGRLIEGYSRA